MKYQIKIKSIKLIKVINLGLHNKDKFPLLKILFLPAKRLLGRKCHQLV